MNRQHHKLNQRQQSEALSAHELQGQQQTTARQFDSVEEALRFDREQTPVPPAVTERLNKSLEALPPAPPRPWWRRLLGE